MSFFWNGYILKDFLFKSFDSKSVSGFLGICIALFSVGVLYEGMHFLKKHLLTRFLDIRKQFREERRRSNGNVISNSDNDIPSPVSYVASDINPRDSLLADDDERPENDSTRNSRPVRNFEFVYLLIASVIHSFYACVGYTLMNAVMTFNVWILIAVCMGIGVGFLFFRTSESSSDISGDTDDCQTRCSIEATCGHEDPAPLMFAETYKTDFNREVVGEGDTVQGSDKPPSSPKSNSSRAHSSMSNESQNHRRKNSSRAKDDDLTARPKVLVVGAQVHNNFQESA